ncbi:MAG: PAS domain S-box protein, partial [Deltaproteobacteria bacterium]|nr:PAS domain S-box protein [Deltaproteobacteria bacterium]
MTDKWNREDSGEDPRGYGEGEGSVGEDRYRFYREIFVHSNDGIAILDPKGRYVEQNPAHFALLGYSDDDLRGRTPAIHMGKKAFLQIFQEVTERGSYRGEVDCQRKNGDTVPIEISASALRNDEKEIVCFVGIKRDITERRLAEETLRKEKEFSSSLIESTPTFFVAIDSRGRTIMMNRHMLDVLGLTAEEVVGKDYLSTFVPRRDREGLAAVFRELTDERRHTVNENRLLTKDGRELVVEWHGAPVFAQDGTFRYFYGVGIDVSERRRAEDLLRQSEERYRILFEQARDVIYCTTPQGGLIEMNQAGLDLLGYPREEFKHIDVADHYLDVRQRDEEKEELETRGFIKDKEIRLRRRDGSEILCLDSATVWRNPDGSIRGYIGTLRDITASRRAEEERVRLEKQLLQAQKMEAIGTLAGGIAHDFNNLLMGIQGRTSLMLTDTDSSHPHFEHLKGIEDYVKSAATLTKQLLGFAKGGRYEVKPTDLNDLIGKSAEMFGRTKKEVTIRTKYQEGLWPIEADRGQIEQVLLNLYVNAWQSMPGGGDLYLETENAYLDGAHARACQLEPGRYVRVSIADTGVGMDERTRERVFDPFFTTKEMGR